MIKIQSCENTSNISTLRRLSVKYFHSHPTLRHLSKVLQQNKHQEQMEVMAILSALWLQFSLQQERAVAIFFVKLVFTIVVRLLHVLSNRSKQGNLLVTQDTRTSSGQSSVNTSCHNDRCCRPYNLPPASIFQTKTTTKAVIFAKKYD